MCNQMLRHELFVHREHHWRVTICVLLAGLMKELQAAQKQIIDLRSEIAQAQLPLLITKAETLPSGARLLAAQVDGMDAKSLQVAFMCLSVNLTLRSNLSREPNTGPIQVVSYWQGHEMRQQQLQYLGNMDKIPCFPAMSCRSCTELVSRQIWAHWQRTIYRHFCRKLMVLICCCKPAITDCQKAGV